MNTDIMRIAVEILSSNPTRKAVGVALTNLGIEASADRGAVRAAIEHIRDLRIRRSKLKERFDPLVRASTMRPYRLSLLREERKRQSELHKIMCAPIGVHWRSDRRAVVAQSHGPEMAERHAVAATLEAVSRLATTKWGFVLRHTSKSTGLADSRYLTLEGVGEVRISNHTIPVYGERAWRYDERGGPRWGEIIIGRHEMNWSVTRWRRELILHAAGRR